MVLTDKEQVAILAIAKNGCQAMGGKTPSDLKYDNFSWFDVADMMEFTELNKHQCAGLIGALEEKGLVGDNGDTDQKYNLYLTDKGIDVAQELFDIKLKQEKTMKTYTINAENISTVSTKDLLATFNEITGANLDRFRDRATGEKRVLKAIADLALMEAENGDVEEVVDGETMVEPEVRESADPAPEAAPKKKSKKAKTGEPKPAGPVKIVRDIFDNNYKNMTRADMIAMAETFGVAKGSAAAIITKRFKKVKAAEVPAA